MNTQTKNYIYFGIINLFIVGIFISANSSLSNPGKNNTAYVGEGIVDTIIGWFTSSDDGICGEGEGDINSACPANAQIGCSCEGGILGVTGKVWKPDYATTTDWSGAVSFCSGLGGGWSLPEVEDLMSVHVELEKYIPNFFVGDAYWSSYNYNATGSVLVLTGGVLPIIYEKESSFSVACVKKSSHSSFLLGELVWSPDQGVMDWNSANIACSALGSSWRLPTQAELETALTNQFIDVPPTQDGFVGDTNYWSSDELEGDPVNAFWVSYFSNSLIYGSFAMKANTFSVRCISSESSTLPPSSLSTESKILDVLVGSIGSVSPSIAINNVNNTITIDVPTGTDVSNAMLRVELSRGAKITAPSGSISEADDGGSVDSYKVWEQNLTTPKTYTVTAEDGKSKTTYTVLVTYPSVPTITVKDEPVPTVSLSVSPSSIYELRTTTLTWSSTGATKCTAIGGDSAWPGNLSVEAGPHSWTTGMLAVDRSTEPKIYTYGIECLNGEGEKSTASKTVKVIPDSYAREGGTRMRMSNVLKEADILIDPQELTIIKLIALEDYYPYRFQDEKAHKVDCPTGTPSEVTTCVEDNNDGAGNYVMVGIKASN
ncbi:DUF1566 domain-containing protein [Candidatus Dojkabacteria bacterium]|jgi:hypothetical protein|nr:DUF1566 domain-containing protein [Candidatus Dojkabacteria bacterium]